MHFQAQWLACSIHTLALGGWVGSSLLNISIAYTYYMQEGSGWVQIACKIAYVLNGRSPSISWLRILSRFYTACTFVLKLQADEDFRRVGAIN